MPVPITPAEIGLSLWKMHFASELGFSDGLEGRVLSGLASCNCILQRRCEGQLRLAAKVPVHPLVQLVPLSVVRAVAGNHCGVQELGINLSTNRSYPCPKGPKGLQTIYPSMVRNF
jgi:hypothetical protein